MSGWAVDNEDDDDGEDERDGVEDMDVEDVDVDVVVVEKRLEGREEVMAFKTG
jgi:hypothetical protein